MRIVCWQTILTKYTLCFFSKNKDVAKIVVCCSSDCPFKGYFRHSECRNVNDFLYVYRIQYVYMAEKEAGFMYMI